MALFGSLSMVRAQLAYPEHFAAAYAFIEQAARTGSAANQQLAGLAPGQIERTDLAGGAFALSQVYLTKVRNEGKWESHGAFIDVQAVFAGEEFMEVTKRSRLAVAEDLLARRDVIFYHPFARGSVLRLGAGDVAVYFPADAHLGGIAVDAPILVRKVVVKVPVL